MLSATGGLHWQTLQLRAASMEHSGIVAHRMSRYSGQTVRSLLRVAHLSRLALTDRAWFGETDRDRGVIGVGELSVSGMAGLVRPS